MTIYKYQLLTITLTDQHYKLNIINIIYFFIDMYIIKLLNKY